MVLTQFVFVYYFFWITRIRLLALIFLLVANIKDVRELSSLIYLQICNSINVHIDASGHFLGHLPGVSSSFCMLHMIARTRQKNHGRSGAS